MDAQTFLLIFVGGVIVVPALVIVAVVDAAQGVADKVEKRKKHK